MDTQDMRYFVEAAAAGSLSKVAQNHLLTPQAMRKCVGRLEAEIGVELLRRSNRGVELTAAGEAFLAQATKALRLCDAGREAARQAAGKDRPRLCVGLHRNANLHLMPRAVKLFRKENPGVEVEFVDFVRYDELERALASGEVQAVMTTGNVGSRREGVHYLLVEYEPTICFVDRESSLASRNEVGLPDLRGMGVVFPRPGHMAWLDRLRRHVEENEPTIRILDNASFESGIMCLAGTEVVGVGIPIVVPPDDSRVMVPFTAPEGMESRMSVELATNRPNDPSVRGLLNAARYVCQRELGFGVKGEQ